MPKTELRKVPIALMDKEAMIRSIEWLMGEFRRTNDALLLTQVEYYIQRLRNKL